jgi:hypothetical protein
MAAGFASGLAGAGAGVVTGGVALGAAVVVAGGAAPFASSGAPHALAERAKQPIDIEPSTEICIEALRFAVLLPGSFDLARTYSNPAGDRLFSEP